MEEMDDFDTAVKFAAACGPKVLPSKVASQLYGLHHAAVVGRCTTKRPGLLDTAARQRWQAWMRASAKYSPEEAQAQYVAVLNKAVPDWRSEAAALPLETPPASPARAAPSPRVFGGVEGGGTRTTVLLVSARGEELARVVGEGSNVWADGWETVVPLLVRLVQEAKAQAGVALDVPLLALGFAMAGMNGEEEQERLEAELRLRDECLAAEIVVTIDSLGAILTASDQGGMVVIAGTGSIAQALLPSGETVRCGGWGHMLGDEGSGYAVSMAAVRRIYRVEDGMADDVPDVTRAAAAMREHFQLADRHDMLSVLHGSAFSKARVASFCAELAALAADGDEFSQMAMDEAGAALGELVGTLLPQVPSPVSVVCVGSLWKSFPLLRNGFCTAVAARTGLPVPPFTLVRLLETGALGAIVAAARAVEAELEVDRSGALEEIFSSSAVPPPPATPAPAAAAAAAPAPAPTAAPTPAPAPTPTPTPVHMEAADEVRAMVVHAGESVAGAVHEAPWWAVAAAVALPVAAAVAIGSRRR